MGHKKESVAFAYVQAFADVVARAGYWPSDFLPPALMPNGGEWCTPVDAALFGTALEQAARRFGDPTFGLTLAAATGLAHLGPVAAKARSSSRPVEYLWSTCAGSVSSSCALFFHAGVGEGGGHTWMEVQWKPMPGVGSIVTDLVLGAWYLWTQEVGVGSGRLRGVGFAGAPPAHPGRHQALFGNCVSFGQPFSSLAYEFHHTWAPAIPASESLAPETTVARFPVEGLSDFHALRRALRKHVENLRETDVRSVCRTAGISERKGREALNAAAVTYYALRKEIQMEWARELLTQTTQPVAEISKAMGYAEVESFCRAFRLHTGVGPAVWRSTQRNAAQG